MKPADFDYHRPASVDETIELLAQYGEDAKILAGGQSLLPIMNMRLAAPEHLIDITGVGDLRRSSRDGNVQRYGATTTHMMLENQLADDPTGGLLRTAASGIGYRAIRTRGTLAGSLAHADASAEWPTVLAALDARVRVRSARGERVVGVRELIQGFFTTTLSPAELITEVQVPATPVRWGFHKSARKLGEFAESLAVVLRRSSGTELWLGAACETPVPLPTTQQMLSTTPDVPPVDDLVAAVASDMGDRAPGDGDLAGRHALHVHAAAVRRALLAESRAEEGATTRV